MAEKRITTPLTDETVRSLKAGDRVLITGVIYTGRDAAHKRLVELLKAGKPLPVDLRGQFIYYVGPAPAKPGQAIGSAGPTTSYRMDSYTPALLEYGLKGMIGKGMRAKEVRDAIIKQGAIYLAAVGGAGALIAKSIKKARIVAYEDLGAEAIYEFTVEDFPAIVVDDVYGNDLYEEGLKQYQRA
ncbi:MAG TPA: Fe-S-containing hydro-lyase [Bacillota bacterium]|jgi:fumarate hydratase subunit beta